MVLNSRPWIPLVAGLMVLTSAVSSASAQAKKLFFVGNSFTLDQDVPGTVARIASSAGKAWPTYYTSLMSGKDFDYHIGRLNGADAWKLSAAKYDAVILQGLSSEPTRAGDPADYKRDAVTLSRMFRSKSPSAKIVLEQTWAYHPTNRELYPYRIPNAYAMNADLVTHTWGASYEVNRALGSGVASVAPVGDIIRYTDFKSDLYGIDWKHQSRKGGVLTSLALYSKIYADNVSDIPYGNVRWWAEPKGISSAAWYEMTWRVDAYYRANAFSSLVIVPEPASAIVVMVGAIFLRRKRCFA